MIAFNLRLAVRSMRWLGPVLILIVWPAGAVAGTAALPGIAPCVAAGAAAEGVGRSAGLAGTVATGGDGACSFCHASQRNSAENEKIKKRIRRCVSMRAFLAFVDRKRGLGAAA